MEKRMSSLVGHAINRARERLGVELTEADVLELSERIQRGELVFVARVSNRRTLWAVTLGGHPATLAYDTRRHTVATVTARGGGDRHGFALSPKQQKSEKRAERRRRRARRRLRRQIARESRARESRGR